MVARGNEVHVATTSWPGSQHAEVLDGVYVHRFDIRGDSLNGVHGETREFLEFVQSRRWDVVSMHHSIAWTSELLLPRLHEISGGKVFVPHGLIGFDNPRFASYFRGLAVNLVHCDAIVALSALTDESRLLCSYGLPSPVVIPNGVDTAQFLGPLRGMRNRWRIGDAPWIVLVSNHSPQKGHARAFEVLRALRKRKNQIRATLIGRHYPAAKWSLGRFGVRGGCWYKCKLRSLKESTIQLQSASPREDVISAIREADLMLLTSKREVSPLTILEGMAAGTPWVSFDVGCLRENTGGIIVESADQMVEATLALLDDSGKRKQLSQEGQSRILERHTWDAVVNRYEQLYSSVSRQSVIRAREARAWS
jgi:glycosyltransferase involved in cell wall biosynthesis